MLFPHPARSRGSCISELLYVRADKFLCVVEAEVVGKKSTAASVNGDQLVVAAADIHIALYTLLDLVPLSQKFASLSSRTYVIALVDFNLYSFYRQMSLPPLSFYFNYTVLRRGLVNHADDL